MPSKKWLTRKRKQELYNDYKNSEKKRRKKRSIQKHNQHVTLSKNKTKRKTAIKKKQQKWKNKKKLSDQSKQKVPIAYLKTPFDEITTENLQVKKHDAGSFYECTCKFCKSYYFKKERNTKNKYSNCCNNGKIKLPSLKPPPPVIRNLLTGNTTDAKVNLLELTI